MILAFLKKNFSVNSKEIANKAIELALNNTSLDEFTERIKEFN